MVMEPADPQASHVRCAWLHTVHAVSGVWSLFLLGGNQTTMKRPHQNPVYSQLNQHSWLTTPRALLCTVGPGKASVHDTYR